MKPITVLHSADMHLGGIVSAFEREINNIRISEIEYTCMSVLDSAKNCDIVLLSGDIFDSLDAPFHICDMFLNKIASMPSVHFFYSCGNHDPYISRTVEYLIVNCPANLHIFGYECVECVTIEQLNTKVYGISFQDTYQKTGLLSDLKKCDSSYINLLCVHGEIAESSVYNPISICDLEQKGFDYVALGHIHKHSGIQRSGKMCYAYPGNPEPGGFDETGDKGIIFGNISKDDINMDFVPVSKRKYHSISVDISSCKDYLSVVNEINHNISYPDDLWKISLIGKNNTGMHLNIDLINQYINAFFVEVSDDTSFPYNIESIAEEFSLMGLCAGETLDRINRSDDEEKEIYKEAFSVLYTLFEQGRDGK